MADARVESPVIETPSLPLTPSLPVIEDVETGSFRNVLRNRSFLQLWMAQLLSQIAFNAANYGIIAIVTQVTGSTMMVGFAIISFTLPSVPFSILAGVYIDYLNKRLILWVCNALRAVATALLVVALIWKPHSIVPLYLITFVIALITQFFTPAEASTIPLLVGKKELVHALSLFNITLTLAQAIGFLVLGRVISTLIPPFHLALGFTMVYVQSIDMLFVVIAIAYTACALLIFSIPSEATKGKQRAVRVAVSLRKRIWKIVRHDVRESWDFIREDHTLTLALLRVSFMSILLLVIGQLAGPFVKNILHLPVADISLIFAPAGVGLVLGGVLMPYLTKWLGKHRTITIGILAAAIGLVLLPLGQYISSQVPIFVHWELFYVGGMAFLIGVALDMVNIPAQTVMQEHTPEDERGRVFSFQAMLYNAGSIPVILFAGLVADTAGIESVMYLLAATLLVFQVWARYYQNGRHAH